MFKKKDGKKRCKRNKQGKMCKMYITDFQVLLPICLKFSVQLFKHHNMQKKLKNWASVTLLWAVREVKSWRKPSSSAGGIVSRCRVTAAVHTKPWPHHPFQILSLEGGCGETDDVHEDINLAPNPDLALYSTFNPSSGNVLPSLLINIPWRRMLESKSGSVCPCSRRLGHCPALRLSSCGRLSVDLLA